MSKNQKNESQNSAEQKVQETGSYPNPLFPNSQTKKSEPSATSSPSLQDVKKDVSPPPKTPNAGGQSSTPSSPVQKSTPATDRKPASNTVTPRDIVKVFAVMMEQTLQKHDLQKGAAGWQSAHVRQLTKQLASIAVKADDALINKGDLDLVQQQAIDAANLAMMVWDRVRLIKEKMRKEDQTDSPR